MTRDAKWKNTKTGKIIEGDWYYMWNSDEFVIFVDDRRVLRNWPTRIRGCEKPEWGNWKLVDK